MTGAPDRGFGALVADDDDDDDDDRVVGAVMRGCDASPVCLGRDVVAALLDVVDTLDGGAVGAEVAGPGVLTGADVRAGVEADEQPVTVRTASATSTDLDLTGQP